MNWKRSKYLGLIMNLFGDFNLARQELKKVALKALYKLVTKRNGKPLQRKYKINDEVL